jgi:hypothetical protein
MTTPSPTRREGPKDRHDIRLIRRRRWRALRRCLPHSGRSVEGAIACGSSGRGGSAGEALRHLPGYVAARTQAIDAAEVRFRDPAGAADR